jgi:hypothetical protein
MSILDDIYNAFDPSPLPAGSTAYVDCKEVRGESDVLLELGKKILRSNQPTCQLYSGHRGGGKSTELLRLAQDLDQKDCFVVYFAAEDEDINQEDTEYTDILLACTRHLLKDLEAADPQPVLSWLKERWQALNDVLQTQVTVTDLKAEVLVQQIAKISAGIRAQPSQRYRIRELLNPHTESLVAALNQFIEDASSKLPQGKQKLVVIADGLDKIIPRERNNGRTTHDEIFVDRSDQLKALKCHVIYTVPISLVFSNRATDVMDIYSCVPHILPMIMVKTRDNQPYTPGIEKLKQIIRSRLLEIDKAKRMSLEAEVFDSSETLHDLCMISGGHVRTLILLVRLAIEYNSDTLPLRSKSILQAVRQIRATYRNAVDESQWALLAKTSLSKGIRNDTAHRNLLFTRCLLEYREEESWYDIHPVIQRISEFQEALTQLPSP